MQAEDANLIIQVITSITNAHGLNPCNVRMESNAVGFRLQGVSGSRQCWATLDHLAIGGCGVLAGSLRDGLVATCYAVR